MSRIRFNQLYDIVRRLLASFNSHTHSGGGTPGSIAHADTTGQTTDDHHAEAHTVTSHSDEANYTLVAGTRAFTGTVGGITPSADADLTTKEYVDDLVIPVDYIPDSINVATGTQDAGDVDSLATLDDGDTLDVSEVGGVPGFNIEIDYVSVTEIPTRLDLHVHYDGTAAHTVNVQIYEIGVGWDTLGTIPDELDFEYLTYAIVNGAKYIDGGNVAVRIRHASSGNPTHDISVDYAALRKIPIGGGGGVTDHGGLTDLDADDHLQYPLLAGRIGGQSLTGSSLTAEDLTLEDNAIDNNTVTVTEILAHHSNDGSDHSFIDQDVTSGSSPTLDGANFTGIPTAGLDDEAVTYAKMQNVSATDRFLGRDAAGAGDVEEITKAAALAILNVADGADVTGSNAPQAHKDSHDPEDGGDALDCAAAGEIVGVAAAAEGSAHSFARSDHTHQIQHSIADNHVLTMDDADAADNDYLKLTASGTEGRSYAEVRSDIESALLRPLVIHMAYPEANHTMGIRLPEGITVTSVHGVIPGGTNVVCRLHADTNRSEIDDHNVTNSTTVTSTTTGTVFTLDVVDLDAADFVILKITSVSGSVEWVEVHIAIKAKP